MIDGGGADAGVEVGERREDEAALGESGVGYLEAFAGVRAALVEDDVEVDGTRAEAKAALDAAEVALDRLERVEEREGIRRQRGVLRANHGSGVEKRGLVSHVRGCRLVQGRVARHREAGGGEAAERLAEDLDTVALVAAERNDGSGTTGGDRARRVAGNAPGRDRRQERTRERPSETSRGRHRARVASTDVRLSCGATRPRAV